MFSIRRNHPYAGILTLCKIRNGAFVAKEMTVPESAFVAAVMQYLDKLPQAETARLARTAPEVPETPPGNGDPKPFRVRKAATAAVG